MRTQAEIDADRELISHSGISKRMSDYRPKIICTCFFPIVKFSWFDKFTRVAYCDRCKLLIQDE